MSVFRAARNLYDFMSSCPPCPDRADMILALGSHDLRVPEHAASLYLAGTAPIVICSGGFGKMTENTFPKPEGAVFAERCMELGVPKDRLLIEDKAANTGENFSLSKRLAQGRDFKTGIAVCKPYMAKRALAAGKMQWPGIRWSVSVPQVPFERYMPDEASMIPEIELIVGDFQRLKVYAIQGYQAPVPIPDELWEQWRLLCRAGFDRYVLPPFPSGDEHGKYPRGT